MKRLKKEIQHKFGTILNFEKQAGLKKSHGNSYLGGRRNFGPLTIKRFAEALGISIIEFRHRYLATTEVEFDLVELVRVLYDNHNCRDREKTTTSHIQAMEYIANVLIDLNFSPDQIPTDTIFYAQIRRFMRETKEVTGHGGIERQSPT